MRGLWLSLLLILAPIVAHSQGCGTSALSCQALAAQDAINAGIDPTTFVRQIQAESNFNPGAVNNASGALGIGQILPSTAANPGFGIAPVNPTDPVAALQFAAQYDAALQARDGSLTAALTDYSGGIPANTTGPYAPVFAAAAAADAGTPIPLGALPGAGDTLAADPGVGDPGGGAAGGAAGDPALDPGTTIVTNEPGTGVGAGQGILDQIAGAFHDSTAGWQAALFNVAQDLFWILAGIELMVSLYLLVMGGGTPDWSDVAFTILHWVFPVGLFWWLLQNGSTFANIIINSLRQAGTVIGGNAITPSAVFWVGINVVTTIWNNMHGFLGMVEEIPVMLAAIPMIISFALAAVWMLMALIEAYVKVGLAALFLAFAPLRWTRNIAVSILMSCLAVGFKLLTISVIVGLGADMINGWAANAAGLSFQGIFVMLGASIAFAALVKIIPDSVERVVYGYAGSLADYHQARRVAIGAAAAAAAPVAAAAGFTALAYQAIQAAAEQVFENSSRGQTSLPRPAQLAIGMGQAVASSAGSEIGGRISGFYRGGTAASAMRMAASIAQGRRVQAALASRPQPPTQGGASNGP